MGTAWNQWVDGGAGNVGALSGTVTAALNAQLLGMGKSLRPRRPVALDAESQGQVCKACRERPALRARRQGCKR